MQLHLTIPGLLWPRKALRDTAYDLDLPTLAWLLGRGRQTWQAAQTPEHALCKSFGIETSEPPAAALRLLGEGETPGADIWLCADPLHLHMDKGRLSLPEARPQIDAEEMRQIVTALSPGLIGSGGIVEFRGGHDGGYLKLATLPAITTTPPSSATGEGRMLPQGADAPLWRRLGNEMQMRLHTLPLNEQRATAGRPPLNTLWFWGAGTLPQRRSVPYERILGDAPLLPGMARWAGIPLSSAQIPPAELWRGTARHTLLWLDDLQASARHHDALTWREALASIEAIWLKGLRSALYSGRLSTLHITALGDEARLDVVLNRSDCLKFWRPAQTLASLDYRDTTRTTEATA